MMVLVNFLEKGSFFCRKKEEVKMGRIITSEAVSEGHPDKICDQISDAILVECLKQDRNSHVGCEVFISNDVLLIGGEITSRAKVDYVKVAKKVLHDIGYKDSSDGFDLDKARYEVVIKEQSSDINQAVRKGVNQGAGDQGIVFGYACDETSNYLPLTYEIVQKILRIANEKRKSGDFKWAKPDMKAQVSIEYNKDNYRVDTIVFSCQHEENFKEKEFKEYIKEEIIEPVLSSYNVDYTSYTLLINPSGRFVIGGPRGDAGLTGRKIIVDTYGGRAHHGGGAFSGKDPSKVDRSGAYYARYVAKNIVASGLAKECEVSVAYAIGKSEAVAVNVDTFNTGKVSDEELARMVKQIFDFRPYAMVNELKMLDIDFYSLAKYGHFGRDDLELPYERLDRIKEIKDYFNL